jgi:iron complex outermembrane receptor protein
MTTPLTAARRVAKRSLACSCILLFGHGAVALAQTTDPKLGSEEPMHLDKFTVSSSQDRGYSTTNAIGVTRSNTPLSEIPQKVDVVSQEFLFDANPSSLWDALRYISGTSASNNLGDNMQIRGFSVSTQHTDGFADNQRQSQLGAEPFLFQRVEILKGPSALVYGSHSSGGVINRVRKTPQWKAAGLVNLTVGNHAQYKGEFDYTAPLNDKFAYRLIGVYRDEDLVEGGVAERFAYSRRWNLEPMLTWRPTPTTQVRVIGEFLFEKAHKHFGDALTFQPYELGQTTFKLLPRDFTVSDESANAWNRKTAYWISLESEVTPDWSVRVASYVNKWTHYSMDIANQGIQTNNRYLVRNNRETFNDDFDVSTAVDSNLNFHLAGADHKFLTLVQYTRTDAATHNFLGDPPPLLDIYNPVYGYVFKNPVLQADTNGDDQSFGMSFQDHAKFFGDKLQLVAGARRDWYSTRTDNLITKVAGKTDEGSNWTYKYGVIYKPSVALSLYYNHAETFSPNFGANPDGQTFVPSTGLINEVGFKTAFLGGRINATVSLFDQVLNNILQQHHEQPLAVLGYREQTAEQTSRGVEADVYLHVIDGWEVMLSFANMKISLPTKLMPRNAPEQTAGAWTRYKFKGARLKGLAVGGGWSWQGTKAAEAGNQVFFAPYHIFDFFAQYEWNPYTFSLNVSNVADEWYLATGVTRNAFFQGPGRLIKFRVSRRF